MTIHISNEIRKQFQLVDDAPETIKQKVEEIVKNIVIKNNLKSECYQLCVQISAQPFVNVAILRNTTPPLLILSKGLLKNVQNEDELAGVIAHQLGYMKLYEVEKNADHHNKVAEIFADYEGVKLLGKAGYNPNVFNLLLQRIAGSDSLISLDDFKNTHFFTTTTMGMIKELSDANPAMLNRIRLLEMFIVSYTRSGEIPEFNEKQRPLPKVFSESVNQITYSDSFTHERQTEAFQCLIDGQKQVLTDNIPLFLFPNALKNNATKAASDPEKYTDVLFSTLGEDDGSESYFDIAKKMVDEIAENTQLIRRSNRLNTLANVVNAQKKLAYYIRDISKQCLFNDLFSTGKAGILVELSMNQCGHDEKLRELIINFLKNSFEEENATLLYEHIDKNYNWVLAKFGFSGLPLLPQEAKAKFCSALETCHRGFREAPIEIKTIFLEPLLFPVNTTPEQQDKKIQELIEQFISTSITEKPQDRAQNIVKGYFASVDLKEQRLLIAATLFVANMQEKGTQELSRGKKLHMILSRMGPAGGKLAQAIHSYPETPADIKRDLAGCKTEFNPPLRWELVELIEKNGLLDINSSNHKSVAHIGKIVGVGSFGITVFNTLSDGSRVADTFIPPNCAAQAEREFSVMLKTVEELVKKDSEMQPVLNLVEEARRSARAETNMSSAKKANDLAEKAYEKFRIRVGSCTFFQQVAPFIDHGETFKRICIAPGQHFNDLKEDDPRKKAIAKAMIVTQLTLRLSGINTDLDRHGGNIKVSENIISHFDFGAMNLEKITEEDKIITGKILARAISAEAHIRKKNRKDFAAVFLRSIEEAQVSEETRVYLNGFTRDFLALGDYIDVLSARERTELVVSCLDAETVDKTINDAFKKELSLGRRALIKVGFKGIKFCAEDPIRIISGSHQTKVQSRKMFDEENISFFSRAKNTNPNNNHHAQDKRTNSRSYNF